MRKMRVGTNSRSRLVTSRFAYISYALEWDFFCVNKRFTLIIGNKYLQATGRGSSSRSGQLYSTRWDGRHDMTMGVGRVVIQWGTLMVIGMTLPPGLKLIRMGRIGSRGCLSLQGGREADVVAGRGRPWYWRWHHRLEDGWRLDHLILGDGVQPTWKGRCGSHSNPRLTRRLLLVLLFDLLRLWMWRRAVGVKWALCICHI